MLNTKCQSLRCGFVYATGAALPNDEILSTSMVVYVLEKYGIQNIRVVDVKTVRAHAGKPGNLLVDARIVRSGLSALYTSRHQVL